VAQILASATLRVGFLTVLHEACGYLGGYLVTNTWGRPIEFQLSTAVQPNRVQQILYGSTLQSYVCADLIGKTLVEKTGATVQLVLTDCEPVLAVRRSLEVPVAWLCSAGSSEVGSPGPDSALRSPRSGLEALCHPDYLTDLPVVREMLDQIDGMTDLTEPFLRIREAIGEARKMGVTGRG
jgi:hypothetical protein